MKSKLARSIAIVAALTAMTGCAVVKDMSAASNNYTEPPESSPHALIRINSEGFVWATANSTCWDPTLPRSGAAITPDRIFIGARGSNGQRRDVIGTPDPESKWAEFRIEADKPIAFRVVFSWAGANHQYACSVKRYFVPKAGAQYNLSSSLLYRDKVCVMSISELAPKPQLVDSYAVKDCT